MRAITVIPGQPGSVELTELPDPEPKEGELLVEPLYLGVCGTELGYGEPPPGHERLVLGHELLGRRLDTGELVAGIVRRPDPVPCACCAQGEWDMCRNGQYTERGIKALDGFGAELVTLEADFAIPVPAELDTLGVLTEPASVLAKAWEQIDRISTRACSAHERVLVIGAGPIGLLGALMGAQRGLELHVLDRATEGPKPEAVQALGGRYHTGDVTEVAKEIEPDLVVECTGVAELVAGAMQHTAPGAIVCLTGVSPSRTLSLDVGALNNELVLENDVIFGSVNANRRHFEQAVKSLADTDRAARPLAQGAREGRRRHQGRGRVRHALAADATLLAMPTSLVTGGAGFLGSHLCDYLISRGQRVICVDNLETGSLENIRHLKTGADFRFEMVDITDHYELEEPIDFVYHMASPASPIDYARLPLHTLKVGAYGTHNTLGLAKKHRARFLLASTSEVYGDPLVHPQPESYWGNVNPIGPRGVYDEAKRYAEALTMAYLRQQGVNTTIVRIFNTFGPRMRANDGRAIPAFMGQALADRPVTVFGDGSQTRSFCYVDDLVRGLVLLAESDVHEPVNIGNPNEMSLLEMAKLIIELTDSRAEVVFEALPVDDPQVRQPDITRARDLLGWAPEIEVRDGIARTIEHYTDTVGQPASR